MIAYYGLLSLVPLLFLLLWPLTLLGGQGTSSFLIRQVRETLPNQSVDDIVTTVNTLREHGAALGLVSLVLLLWSSLGFLSAMASALNIIYGVPNGPFLRQKFRILLLIVVGFAGVSLSVTGLTILSAWTHDGARALLGAGGSQELAGQTFSTVATAVFLFGVYRYIPNTRVTTRDIVPGLAFATIGLQASLRLLPTYNALVATVPTIKALGGIVVLLVWFYLMANIVLIGAEINWWHGVGRRVEPEGASASPEGDRVGGDRTAPGEGHT
jgi:membrane protein